MTGLRHVIGTEQQRLISLMVLSRISSSDFTFSRVATACFFAPNPSVLRHTHLRLILAPQHANTPRLIHISRAAHAAGVAQAAASAGALFPEALLLFRILSVLLLLLPPLLVLLLPMPLVAGGSACLSPVGLTPRERGTAAACPVVTAGCAEAR